MGFLELWQSHCKLRNRKPGTEGRGEESSDKKSLSSDTVGWQKGEGQASLRQLPLGFLSWTNSGVSKYLLSNQIVNGLGLSSTGSRGHCSASHFSTDNKCVHEPSSTPFEPYLWNRCRPMDLFLALVWVTLGKVFYLQLNECPHLHKHAVKILGSFYLSKRSLLMLQ